MELTYTKCDDYYIPDIAANDTTEDYQLGRYGRMRLRYLKEHRPGVYSQLLSKTLWKHLTEIDAACNGWMDNLIPAVAAREGVTKALKASGQMEWVGRMNNIRQRAEEMVLDELVYAR